MEVNGIVSRGTALGVASLDQIPEHYQLFPNYPNPFNPSTVITYVLPVRSVVRMLLYNSLGQVVAELVNGEEQAGLHSVVWNARTASGVYVCRFNAASSAAPSVSYASAVKMMLVK
jgi:hypothetical protein